MAVSTITPSSGTRRALGAYYTPEDVADALLRWALNGRQGRVLDPSFGGCAFLRRAVSQLAELGDTPAQSLIFGTDLDVETGQWRNQLVNMGVPEDHLLNDDFLGLRPDINLPKCEAVVGNPPYVRHHWISAATKVRAKSAMESMGYSLSGRASLWAPFVVHASRFVEIGGRMAFLLPGAALDARYAHEVRSALLQRFARVTYISLDERLFPDAQESTVVLLAEGNSSVGSSQNLRLKTRSDLLQWLEGSRLDESPMGQPKDDASDSSQLLATCYAAGVTSTLGDIGSIRIGTVTGANRFFVRPRQEIVDVFGSTAGHSAKPVVARGAWLRQPILDHRAWESKTPANASDHLLILPATRPSLRTKAGKEIRKAEESGISAGSHCRRRKPWWSIVDTATPDAFLGYMVASTLRVSINRIDAGCTNAVHRVNFRDRSRVEDHARSLAISALSAPFALAAELLGREYGGGLLKLEPSICRLLPVLTNFSSSLEELLLIRDASAMTREIDAMTAAQLSIPLREVQRIRQRAASLREDRQTRSKARPAAANPRMKR